MAKWLTSDYLVRLRKDDFHVTALNCTTMFASDLMGSARIWWGRWGDEIQQGSTAPSAERWLWANLDESLLEVAWTGKSTAVLKIVFWLFSKNSKGTEHLGF